MTKRPTPRRPLPALIASVGLAVAGSAAASTDNVVLQADEIEYVAGPASIPDGAGLAVLYGDPGEADLFAMRLRLPQGYHIPPHSHTRPEVVTVISGAFLVGTGEEADPEAAMRLEPGAFFAFQPGHVHYAYAGAEDTVIQLNSTGPWTITYADPADDPRRSD